MRRHHDTSVSEEGSVSIDNPFTYDFESIDEDIGEDSFSIDSPGRNIHCSYLFYYLLIFLAEIRRSSSVMKQSTLPAGRRPPCIYHKRSYSESKTFEMNGYSEDKIKSPADRPDRRFRNHSVTESSTSGISSYESLQGFKNAGNAG